jgi:NAD(P)-dependent dehydrogenase (short-subunit alcohol dehydrogenase family)
MVTRDLAIEQLAHAGVVTATALALTTEVFRDWPRPLTGPASGGQPQDVANVALFLASDESS